MDLVEKIVQLHSFRATVKLCVEPRAATRAAAVLPDQNFHALSIVVELKTDSFGV